MVVIVNLTLGMITRPWAACCSSPPCPARVFHHTALTREMPPFLLAHFVVLALLTLRAQLSTRLPHSPGF